MQSAENSSAVLTTALRVPRQLPHIVCQTFTIKSIQVLDAIMSLVRHNACGTDAI